MSSRGSEDLTYESLVEQAKPTSCDDCAIDGQPARILCVGCLEQRIARRLKPDDFADLPLNEPGVLESHRLLDRLGAT